MKSLWEKKALRDCLISSCALGLLWAWFLCAGNVGSRVFGVETAYSATARLANSFSVMVFLLLFGSKRLNVRFPYRKQILFGMAGCLASTCFFLALQLLAPDNDLLFVAFLFLAGFSYVVLLNAWIRKNLLENYFQLSVRVMFASIIMIFLYIVLQALPTPITAWGAMGTLVLAGILMGSLQDRKVDLAGRIPLAKPSRGNILLLAGIVLANFANGLLVTSWISSSAVNWFYAVIPLGIVLLLFIFRFGKLLAPYSEFALLSVFVCANILVIMALPSSTPLLASLIFATFWLVFAFSLSVAIWNGACWGEDPSRTASLHMGCIVMGTFSSRFVGVFAEMQDMISLVAAAVLLAFSLALALVAGSAMPPADEAGQTLASAADEAGQTLASTADETCKAIALEKDLTEREYDVFCLLAKGHSLKSIAEKLYVSENTVKSHRRRIYLKLDINTRQELIDLVEAGRNPLP